MMLSIVQCVVIYHVTNDVLRGTMRYYISCDLTMLLSSLSCVFMYWTRWH
jgi:hypothetical protein